MNFKLIPFFRICNSESQNISIFNTRMNHAAAVVRQPYSPGGWCRAVTRWQPLCLWLLWTICSDNNTQKCPYLNKISSYGHFCDFALSSLLIQIANGNDVKKVQTSATAWAASRPVMPQSHDMINTAGRKYKP